MMPFTQDPHRYRLHLVRFGLAFALLTATLPTSARAQEEMCAGESAAADAAAAVLEVDETAYMSTLDQILAVTGALSAYPELAALQASLMADAAQLLATSEGGAVDPNAVRDWARTTAQGEAAQLQGGLVGQDGATHPEVQQLVGLEQTAVQQAQAMTADAQKASSAFITLVGCLTPGTNTGPDTGAGSGSG